MNRFVNRLGAVPSLCVLVLLLVASPAPAQIDRNYVVPVIEASRGADPGVDYESLTRFGPWDDRNYSLIAEDLEVLGPDEAEISDPIPAFYRVGLRKHHPHLSSKAKVRYPRSAVNAFRQRFGGYLVDGVLYRGVERVDGRFLFVEESRTTPSEIFAKFLSGETRLTNPNGAAESAISISPASTNFVVAGTNGPGAGQKMHYSTDGGENWAQSAALPLGGTCCDPTIDWSIDGTKVYTATLGNCGFGGCAIWVYRSDDNGQTWTGLENATPGDPRRELTTGGSDKEYLHVDRWPASPYADHLYISWHDGNIVQFARSTDFGATFEPTISFNSEPRGIGSDLTTDKSGNLYYIYPAFEPPASIRLLKSTDGGASFQPSTVIATTNASFIFPVPSMETREVFVYTAVDIDLSGGVFDETIYAAWTDSTAATSGTAANNHARIQVGYSRDGGATWTVTTPHETDDLDAVDRYHPWLSVDENGNVHVVFYDTRNDPTRQSVDFYYTVSSDGAQTWTTPVRLTAESSPNIADNFEFGDYNGMDIKGADSIAVWTDNRVEPEPARGGNDSVDVYAAGGFAKVGDSFVLTGNPTEFGVCAPDTVNTALTIAQVGAFSETVTLSTVLPPGFSNSLFSNNPVTPPATSNFGVDVSAMAAGTTTLQIAADSASVSRTLDLSFVVNDGVSPATTNLSPSDGASGVSTRATLEWAAVAGVTEYRVELDDDPAFGSPEFDQTVFATSAIVPGLATTTEYFWRVTPVNACGSGPASPPFSFTTSTQFCSAPGAVLIDPDEPNGGLVTDTIVATGGTVDRVVVSVDLSHSYVGDSRAVLVHLDSGTEVTLYDRPGVPASQFGCDGDDVVATFTDDATTTAEDVCAGTPPAISGSVLPVDPMSTFSGLPISADWQLQYYDDEGAGTDTGVLNSWCIEFAELDPIIFADGFESPTPP